MSLVLMEVCPGPIFFSISIVWRRNGLWPVGLAAHYCINYPGPWKIKEGRRWKDGKIIRAVITQIGTEVKVGRMMVIINDITSQKDPNELNGKATFE